MRDDLELLRSLSSQHLIAALGVNFSPPLLAVELAPLGTLRDYLNTGKCLGNKPLNLATSLSSSFTEILHRHHY